MAFIAKNPLIAPELVENPPRTLLGYRGGIFVGNDGWIEEEQKEGVNDEDIS